MLDSQHRDRFPCGGRSALACRITVLMLFAGVAFASDPSGSETKGDAEPKDEFVIVEGQITDATGRGLEDAAVRVFRVAEYPDGEPIATADTNELGDFAVTASEALAGSFVVTVSKEPYALHTQQVEVQTGELPPYVATSLRGTLVLSGRVVDAAANDPIPRATVRFQSVGANRSTTSDDDGHFSIDGLSPGEGRILASAAGFGREVVTVPSIQDAGDLTVILKPERVIGLMVVDDLGVPISGVVVEALDRARDDFRTAVTGDVGRAELVGLNFDARTLELRLTHEGHVSSIEFDRRIDLPSDEPRSDHELFMQRAGTITGQVLNGPTGGMLYGARVMTGTEYSDDSPRAWSDERGSYTITGVAPGLTTLTVHMRGFAAELKRLEVRPGKTTRIDFALRPPVRVTGVVKSKEGEPIVGAEVRSVRWLGELTLGLRAMTDEKGRFVFADSPHDEYDVAVTAPGYRLHKQTIRPASNPFEFVLEPLPNAPSTNGVPLLNKGDDAPVVTLTTLRGKPLNLAELKGKIVVIDFWATWCAACLPEMHHLSKLYDTYGQRKDFVLISISRDFDEDELRSYLKQNEPFARWHHIYGEPGGVEDARRAYGVNGIPRLFIIGRDGKIVDRDLRGERLLELVNETMTGAASED